MRKLYVWWSSCDTRKNVKIILKVFCWKHLYRIPVEASQMAIAWKLPDQEEFSFFFSVHLGCDFTPLAPPTSHHPLTINISTSQSIFIIKHMPNAICGCEDTGLLFIHLIYLYFFPEGETLVSIHLCWLLAITEHLEPPLNWPGGSTILKRSTGFRAKRCVCCVCFCGGVRESYNKYDSKYNIYQMKDSWEHIGLKHMT